MELVIYPSNEEIINKVKEIEEKLKPLYRDKEKLIMLWSMVNDRDYYSFPLSTDIVNKISNSYNNHRGS